jgi:Na+-transporting NADH:ubiquinone oxidoreductase subunit F
MILAILIAVLIVSSIGAALAALLVISESFIANYGECEININDEKKMVVQGGGNLLSALTQEKIFVPSACGGRGTCGLCKLKVHEGAGLLLPTEEPYLNKEERQSNVRLSCQVKIRNNLKIEIPEELFSIKEYVCTCSKIIDLTHDIKQFRFELIEPEAITFIPGQYVQLLTPVYEKNSEEVYRAYSMSSDPAENNAIETIIRLVPGGICTTWCFEYLKEGDQVRLNGPYGHFRLSENTAPMLFIAGGSGMSPMKCLLHHMKNTQDKRKTTYFFGANRVKELFLTDRMRQFEKELPDFTFVPVVAKPDPDEQWDGETGLVTQAVERRLKDVANYEAYLCGSPGMIDASIVVLKKLGITEDRIFYDKFA